MSVAKPSESDSNGELARRPFEALIEVEPGVGVFFGEEIPSDLEILPFEILGETDTEGYFDGLAKALSLGSTAALALDKLDLSGRVVQFDAPTEALLKVGHLMESDGKLLGPIVNNNGRIIGQARFVAKDGFNTSAAISAIGPQAPLLAIQMQLASISKRLDQNLELTSEVLHEHYREQESDLRALKRVIDGAVEEAKSAGSVNDHVYGEIRSLERDLLVHCGVFRGRLDEHARALSAGTHERREYIQDNSQRIIADMHATLISEQTWVYYRVLRACHILYTDPKLEQNSELFDAIVEKTREEHAIAMDRIVSVLGECERQSRLLSLLPQKRAVPLISKRKGGKEVDVATIAGILAAHAAHSRLGFTPQRSLPEPEIRVFQESVSKELLEILQWVLPAEENLLALADVKLGDSFRSPDAFLAITNASLFISAEDSVLKQGMFDQQIPLSDIRYVRLQEREGKGPLIDIITKDENIKISFYKWAHDENALKAVRRVANLLLTAMNLPEEERRDDPLLELPTRSRPVELTTGDHEAGSAESAPMDQTEPVS